MQNEMTEMQVYECFCLFLISFSGTLRIMEINVGIYNDFTEDACWGFYKDPERWHLQGTHHPTQAPTQTQVVGAKQGGKDQEQANYKPYRCRQEEEGEASAESESSYEPYWQREGSEEHSHVALGRNPQPRKALQETAQLNPEE